jgi:hypothetical protein
MGVVVGCVLRSVTSRASALVLASIATFSGCIGVAMTGYPGGTWTDRTTVGHSFWGNFVCDLLRYDALNGLPNQYPALAAAGMIALVVGLLAFWFAAPRLFARRPRLGLAVRVLGVVATGAMAVVPFTPADRFGAAHGVAVMVATVPALGVAALVAGGMLSIKGTTRLLGLLGAATVAASFADSFLLYVRDWIQSTSAAILLPALERVSLLLLLAWMAVTALRLRELDAIPNAQV